MKKNEQFEIPEKKEEYKPHIEIQDISTFSGLSLEELSRKAIEIILEKVRENPISENRYRRKYNLTGGQPFAKELERYAQKITENHQRSAAEKMLLFKQQADDCFALAKKKEYLAKTRDYKIIIADNFLHYGLQPSKFTPTLNSYSQDLNAIYIELNAPNKLLAHEIGHVLSTRPHESATGFTRLEKSKEGRIISVGNKWFNEGVTVMWEETSVNDNSVIPSREEEGDYYGWCQAATHLVMKKLALNEDTVFKAYFGNYESRNLVEQKLKEYFKCTLEDLRCLSLKLDMEFTKKIIQGDKVELIIKNTTSDSAIKQMDKLSEIFPNVSIIDTRKDK